MHRHFVPIMILIAAIFAAMTAFAQRPYDDIMKDIQATSASLKKNLDGTGAQGKGAVLLDGRGRPIRGAQNKQASGPRSPEEIRASAAAALEDATKLEGLFKEVGQFWASVETEDAVTFAKTAEEAAAAIVNKVRGNDYSAAQTAYGTIEQSCVYCHFSHREKTGNGFIIKP
jgi:hypothetical protein